MRRLGERAAYLLGCAVGGAWFLLCSFLGIVWLLIKPHNRQTLYWYGRIFCRGLVRMMGWTVDPDHPERLAAHRPCVIAGNHQSFLDVVTFGSIFPPRTVSAGKRQIGRIPIFGDAALSRLWGGFVGRLPIFAIAFRSPRGSFSVYELRA